MDKIKHISRLFFAGGDGGPDSFAPAHAGLSARSLGDTAVNNDMANFSLGAIIGRLNIGVGYKAEIVVSRFGFEPSFKLFGQFMFRRSPNLFQKALLEGFHLRQITFGRRITATDMHAYVLPHYAQKRKLPILTF